MVPSKKLLLAHQKSWRDPAQIVSYWESAQTEPNPELFRYYVTGNWWEALEATKSTLLITREYEHLVIAITMKGGKPRISYLNMPHPSGLCVDEKARVVYIVSSRNPNMLFEFAPIRGWLSRSDAYLSERQKVEQGTSLIPRSANFLPGSSYIHDIALINGKLHANFVGENSVARLYANGGHKIVWWPNCIQKSGLAAFDRNYIQLNSIAASRTIEGSFFSASTDRISARRPGHRNFPVDGRGVIFSGKSREPIARGLTRPHSARLHKNRLYVDNSGYGELLEVDKGRLVQVAKLPGWTRGLAFKGQVAFVGSSRVLRGFEQYAPGLNINQSKCGIHAIDLRTGSVLGSLFWPSGNQIFALDFINQEATHGFPTLAGKKRSLELEKKLHYTALNQTRK